MMLLPIATLLIMVTGIAGGDASVDTPEPLQSLRTRDRSVLPVGKNILHRGGSGIRGDSSGNDDSGRPTKQRGLKGTAKSSGSTPAPVKDGSCTSKAENFECDGPGTVAICYEHDDHYHNKCVDFDHEDIFNKVPGQDLYKDKYPLTKCGCCDETILNNIFTEVKYPKSYDKDLYCEKFPPTMTPTTSVAPSATPRSTRSARRSRPPDRGSLRARGRRCSWPSPSLRGALG